MSENIRKRLDKSDAVSNVSTGEDLPQEDGYGVIFFRLQTDETENQLKRFQPETSTIVVGDEEIVEFDVRLGRWKSDNPEREISNLREIAKRASRSSYISIWRIDRGGGQGFVPHIRMTDGRAHPDAFVDFIENLAQEVEFLKSLSEN